MAVHKENICVWSQREDMVKYLFFLNKSMLFAIKGCMNEVIPINCRKELFLLFSADELSCLVDGSVERHEEK